MGAAKGLSKGKLIPYLRHKAEHSVQGKTETKNNVNGSVLVYSCSIENIEFVLRLVGH